MAARHVNLGKTLRQLLVQFQPEHLRRQPHPHLVLHRVLPSIRHILRVFFLILIDDPGLLIRRGKEKDLAHGLLKVKVRVFGKVQVVLQVVLLPHPVLLEDGQQGHHQITMIQLGMFNRPYGY